MEIKNFQQIRDNMKSQTRRTVAVASAIESKTLKAVLKAEEEGLIDYVLTGDGAKIQRVATENGLKISTEKIIDTKDDFEAAEKAVALVNSGEADFLQKGLLHTAAILKAVVNKEHGLRTKKMMNYVAMFEMPGYHKVFAITDGGMQISPDVDKKKQMIESTVELFHSFGVEDPKVACMCALEEVNPKIQATIDAAALRTMNERGQIKGCTIEGPISFDLAMNPETAKVKGFTSPVAGNADIILVPEINAGNMLIKGLYSYGGATMGGVVLGGKCPISMTSRDSTVEGRVVSLLLSCSILNGEK